jgi:hypothetical protein
METNTQYHADTTHISASMLKTWGKSRREFEAVYITKTRPTKKPSRDMILGTALHACLLEPDVFAASYRQLPAACITASGAMSTSKDARAEIEYAESQGVTLLKASELDDIACMAASVREAIGVQLQSPQARFEQSGRWTSSLVEMRCKYRPDIQIEYQAAVDIFDLKTCDDASPRGWLRSVENFEYPLAEAHYREGAEATTGKPVDRFVYAVVEREWPYTCAAYEIDAQSLAEAREVRRQRMEQIEQAMVTGDYRLPWQAAPDRPPIILRARSYVSRGINQWQEIEE